MNKKLLSEIMRELGSVKSEAKTAACRANGLKPCAPGKHRGRPRKIEHNKKA